MAAKASERPQSVRGGRARAHSASARAGIHAAAAVRLMRQLPLYNVEATKYTKFKNSINIFVLNHTCIHHYLTGYGENLDIVFDLKLKCLRCTIGCFVLMKIFIVEMVQKTRELEKEKKRFFATIFFSGGVLYVLELSKLLIFVLF